MGIGCSKAYLVCFIIQAIFSVVQWEAAMIRSPSFSLPSSSMTTKNSPRAKASNASSIESKSKPFARPFALVERLAPFVGFRIEDDRGCEPDMTGLCLKSATGAITVSCALCEKRRKRRRGRLGGKIMLMGSKLKRTSKTFPRFICGLWQKVRTLTSGKLLTSPTVSRLTKLMAGIRFCFPSVCMPATTPGFSVLSFQDLRTLQSFLFVLLGSERPTRHQEREVSMTDRRHGDSPRRHGPEDEFRFGYKPSFFH